MFSSANQGILSAAPTCMRGDELPQEDMCQATGTPPDSKYESEGGPGIARIMKLLLGSCDAFADRRTFLASQILFWILGAPDGHAKNFSLFIEPKGRYSLTPLYDVMSAYPVMGHGRGFFRQNNSVRRWL